MDDHGEQRATRLLQLHARVIRREPWAVEQLSRELRLPLCRRLKRAFPRATADSLIDAVDDSLLAYTAQPQAFDADRHVPLDVFIFGIAARILRNRLRSDVRRSVRERDYCEHVRRAYGDHIVGRAASRIATQEVRRALPVVCNATELSAMMAWLNEDDSGAVAVCLGLSHLPRTEQQREVQRFMARVIKRLQRRFGLTSPRFNSAKASKKSHS